MIKRYCIMTEENSEQAFDTLCQMFYELKEKHYASLIVYIPDYIENQAAVDAFMEVEKGYAANCIVAGLGKRKTVGEFNPRSTYVDLKRLDNKVVEMIGKYKAKDKEFYTVSRDWTVDTFPKAIKRIISMSDVLVGLWRDGALLQKPMQYANSLRKEVVVVDL